MRRLLCAVMGHRPQPIAARDAGRHVTGDLCGRCRRVLSLKAGSRQARRRVLFGR